MKANSPVPFPKLLVVDLDGTILGGGYVPYARIPDPVCRFLDELADRGCDWATNTSWAIEDQWKMLCQSRLKSKPIFLVGEFGRRMAQPGRDGPVSLEPYTGHTDQLAAQLARQSMLPIVAEISREFSPTRIQYYQHLLSFTFAPDDPKAPELEARSRQWPGVRARWKPPSLGITLKDINKGRGIAEILRRRGYHPREVVVAGDEISDIPMMDDNLAFHAICPANADPLVKAHVLKLNGIVARQECGPGVIEAFGQLVGRHGWTPNVGKTQGADDSGAI